MTLYTIFATNGSILDTDKGLGCKKINADFVSHKSELEMSFVFEDQVSFISNNIQLYTLASVAHLVDYFNSLEDFRSQLLVTQRPLGNLPRRKTSEDSAVETLMAQFVAQEFPSGSIELLEDEDRGISPVTAKKPKLISMFVKKLFPQVKKEQETQVFANEVEIETKDIFPKAEFFNFSSIRTLKMFGSDNEIKELDEKQQVDYDFSAAKAFKDCLSKEEVIPQSNSIFTRFATFSKTKTTVPCDEAAIPAGSSRKFSRMFEVNTKKKESDDLNNRVFSPNTHSPSYGYIPLIQDVEDGKQRRFWNNIMRRALPNITPFTANSGAPPDSSVCYSGSSSLPKKINSPYLKKAQRSRSLSRIFHYKFDKISKNSDSIQDDPITLKRSASDTVLSESLLSNPANRSLGRDRLLSLHVRFSSPPMNRLDQINLQYDDLAELTNDNSNFNFDPVQKSTGIDGFINVVNSKDEDGLFLPSQLT